MNSFDDFFNGFLEAAFWSTSPMMGEDEHSDYPEDYSLSQRGFSPSDLTEDSATILRAHALSFYARCFYLIEADECNRGSGEYSNSAQAGHDFWLTSQGHGAGFWDGDWPTHGDSLTKFSKCYPEGLSFFITEDGEISLA